MKYPQYYEIDDVYIKVDQDGDQVHAENTQGRKCPLTNSFTTKRPLREEAFKRVKALTTSQSTPFKYYKVKYGDKVLPESPYEQDLVGLIERNVRQINAGEEFTIVTQNHIELFNSQTVYNQPVAKGAFILALIYHRDQLRKGDKHPYLEHPLEVAHILWQHHFPENIIAAAYCHDLLEDTGCAAETITLACNSDVTRIVEAVTNDENLSDYKDWEEKKLKYIDSVRQGGPEAIAVSIADKIVNMKSLLNQYDQEGREVWQHFNRGKDKKVWYEQQVFDMASSLWSHPLLNDYQTLLERMKQLEA